MRSEDEIQEKADELADRIDASNGSDSQAMYARQALEWALELSNEI